MNIPNFHDGHFDGLRIGPSKLVNLFLRTQDGKSFTLVLQEVYPLTLSEIKEGNIIFDLVFRSTGELTRSDMAELYSVDVDAPQAADLLRAKREKGFQLLEINASYGAQGSVLFQTSRCDSQLLINAEIGKVEFTQKPDVRFPDYTRVGFHS